MAVADVDAAVGVVVATKPEEAAVPAPAHTVVARAAVVVPAAGEAVVLLGLARQAVAVAPAAKVVAAATATQDVALAALGIPCRPCSWHDRFRVEQFEHVLGHAHGMYSFGDFRYPHALPTP